MGYFLCQLFVFLGVENNRCDLQAALKRKRHTVSTQKFTQSDVQRTKLDRLQRQQEKEKLQKEIDDLNKHIWENEINFSRIHEKVYLLTLKSPDTLMIKIPLPCIMIVRL